MRENIIENDAAISLGSTDQGEDMEPWEEVVDLNVRPEDGRCHCCGRYLDELEPFGKAGDPLIWDFDGCLLVRQWRPSAPPPPEKVREIYDEFFDGCNRKDKFATAKKMLVQEYGEEEAECIILAVSVNSCPTTSWECRDCIVLSHIRYFDKLGWDLKRYYSWERERKGRWGVIKFEKGSEREIKSFWVPLKKKIQN